MYLKSIEMHGFKSFANKIVLEFHNGITGIVGPNGSGKSNVADAVRWVLGEQSAKQLRGASMQDVIFSGTENRRPHSYAYVSITLDNSDHVLPVEYQEVTITRRVYRSGESEYLMNGVTCRLRDVNELFYDTGIGKEGYSIIGQGQIERIISGKPEERRELFDEAVGIVKFKKRKATSIKKLQEEEDNLTRISDILGELERQVGPLEQQAEKARNFLQMREELKKLDINMFLVDAKRLEAEKEKLTADRKLAGTNLDSAKAKDETITSEYDALELQLEEMDRKIEELRTHQSQTSIDKEKLEGQIRILEKEIEFAKDSDDTRDERRREIRDQHKLHQERYEEYLKQKEEVTATLSEVTGRLERAQADYRKLEDAITAGNALIDKDNKELLELMEDRAKIRSMDERNQTLFEQTNIRKSQLTSRILSRKTQEDTLLSEKEEKEKAHDKAKEALSAALEEQKKLTEKQQEMRSTELEKREEERRLSEEITRSRTQLEAIQNIAERYEGYGSAVRFVMDQKHPSVCGAIADLIHVEKKYETAIETALGGNIQNIVTDDEKSAKELIERLKKNKAGRATFLPVDAVRSRGEYKEKDALSEKGAIGVADTLVEADSKYDSVLSHLLGNIMVCDNSDNALAIARKYKYSLHIVTLEGEYLRPGGSLSGGSFKHNANLLGRTRQIEELEKKLKGLEKDKSAVSEEIGKIAETRQKLAAEIREAGESVSRLSLEENTAMISLQHASAQVEESKRAADSLKEEGEKLENALREIDTEKKNIARTIKESEEREAALKKEMEQAQHDLDQNIYMETAASNNVSEIQIEEASAKTRFDAVSDNLKQVEEELEKDKESIKRLDVEADEAREDAKKKEGDIIKIRETIAAAGEKMSELDEAYRKALEDKDEMSTRHKGFFTQKEAIQKEIANLEKEIYRLDNMLERNEAYTHEQSSYMWDEYEMTLHQAKELRDESLTDRDEMKKDISALRTKIRQMGDVNVHAIEEYREVSERYDFLKGQHEDLTEAREKLIEIINELDEGMREQFTKGFADIKREFDSAFKELFGGGHGNLELQEDEDLLESGIRIIAQPPGKKLQNMMQLSGGEKSLTAIALLFAIQNLKPSPFCLLDEIEAALDDSNVERFASYLHKLTKNTQFIVITHRRGTMNSADRLYGITMQEKGISTLVSVNLVEADLDD